MGSRINVSPNGGLGGAVDVSAGEGRFAKLTRNEQLVYDRLCDAQRPLKAYDLLELLRDRGLRAPMTIYRALDSLITKGYARKIECLNAFMATNVAHAAQLGAVLICRKCKQAKEVPLDAQQVEELFAPLKVLGANVRIEAFADCPQVCGEIKELGLRCGSPYCMN